MVDDLILQKYPHRRYYDRVRRRFVRLVEIAELVKEGARVAARDAEGRDITAELFGRIIVYEQAQTGEGPLTADAMRSLIRLVTSDASSGLPVCLGSVAAFLDALTSRSTTLTGSAAALASAHDDTQQHAG